MTDHGDITRLLGKVRVGNPEAFDRLFELVYGELRRRAHHQLAEGPATLGTTELVHEIYLNLAGAAHPEWNDRLHFYRVAARAMRQVVMDRARRHLAGKRGGGVVPLELDPSRDGAASPSVAAESLVALDDALLRLAERNPRLSKVVELRFFGGLTVEETAGALEVSDRTVKRDWRLARAFLQDVLAPDGKPGS
jgi:RNA polymerase sigma factor (TIGR02999 family)